MRLQVAMKEDETKLAQVFWNKYTRLLSLPSSRISSFTCLNLNHLSVSWRFGKLVKQNSSLEHLAYFHMMTLICNHISSDHEIAICILCSWNFLMSLFLLLSSKNTNTDFLLWHGERRNFHKKKKSTKHTDNINLAIYMTLLKSQRKRAKWTLLKPGWAAMSIVTSSTRSCVLLHADSAQHNSSAVQFYCDNS